jgi:hypothetical protein
LCYYTAVSGACSNESLLLNSHYDAMLPVAEKERLGYSDELIL